MKSRANKQSGATIKDVAERAGVSAMTVSRVLNEAARVRPETRDRVRAAIEELNYKPNISARSLAKAQSFFIGLFYNNPNPGYISELLVGLLNRCRQAGYHLMIENCGNGEEDWEGRVEALIAESNFDGVITSPPVSDFSSVRRALEEAGLPHVRIAPETAMDAAPFVATDDFDAASRITHHLIELGHKRIGFIRGDEAHGASRQREEGFRAAMARSGLLVNEDWLAQGQFTYRSGLEATENLLAGDERPTAVFASNDDMAAAVIAIAHKHGLEVPTDLSVAGFDDTQTATTVWPQLTTIRQPIADMAASAIDLLAEQMKSGMLDPIENSVRLPSELIIRGSSASPKRN